MVGVPFYSFQQFYLDNTKNFVVVQRNNLSLYQYDFFNHFVARNA